MSEREKTNQRKFNFDCEAMGIFLLDRGNFLYSEPIKAKIYYLFNYIKFLFGIIK